MATDKKWGELSELERARVLVRYAEMDFKVARKNLETAEIAYRQAADNLSEALNKFLTESDYEKI